MITIFVLATFLPATISLVTESLDTIAFLLCLINDALWLIFIFKK